MKKYMLASVLLLAWFLALIHALPPLPTCYHTYAEIETELQQIEIQYPTQAKLYTIGHSQQDNVPIYALKISDHVLQEENEPAVLFIGQVHAEEVLGVETTMSNIHEILQNAQYVPYGSWISQLELWFIPTINPEGHNVVTSGLDPSYRKNKRDVNNNGIFDYNPNVGLDLDGVDINRNFPFNWVHGDTLWQPVSGTATEAFDYYRGAASMSESETQALMAFGEAQKPVFCIVWHSSRNVYSNLFEGVSYPLNWYGVRPCPDLALGQQIGEGVASQIVKENGTTTYEPAASSARKGDINTWLYKQFGTICLVIECGTNNMQPDSLLMVDTVNRCTNGVKWLLNRALSTSSAVPSNSMLRGTITDAVSQIPLQAEIIVEQKNAPWFAPRKSDPVNGSYWRPVSNNTVAPYTLRFRKKGYADYVIPNQTVNNGSWTTVNVAMQPLDPVTVHGTVRNEDGSILSNAEVTLYDVETETLQTNGTFDLTTYPGEHKIVVTAEGYYPYIDTLVVAAGTQNINLYLVLSNTLSWFSEEWENGTTNWVKNSHWVTENFLSQSGYALTDSWGGLGFYPMNCNNWIRTQSPIPLPSTGNPLLIFDENLYTEFIYDSVRVEVSTDTLSWHTVYSNSGQYDWWHPVFVPLSQYGGSSVYLRFRLTDQSTDDDLTDPGWTIDNVRIVTGSATPTSDDSSGVKPVTYLYPNFPNPFTTGTRIRFSLGKESSVALAIYNLKGEKVRTLAVQPFKRGQHMLEWDGTDERGKSVGSGLYFYRLKTTEYTLTRKMVLLK